MLSITDHAELTAHMCASIHGKLAGFCAYQSVWFTGMHDSRMHACFYEVDWFLNSVQMKHSKPLQVVQVARLQTPWEPANFKDRSWRIRF